MKNIFKKIGSVTLAILSLIGAIALFSSYQQSSGLTDAAYNSPAMLWSAIRNKPTTVAGYGISDAVSTAGSYSNPSWLTGLAWGKITGVPTILSSLFWGQIGGTLSSQTDLAAAINAKFTLPSGGTIGQFIDGTGALQSLPATAVTYINGVVQPALKHLMFSGTTTSGSVTFYMTNGGTSGGAALCPTAAYNPGAYVNDPSNIYGSTVTTNIAAKTLTVSVNQRNFSGVTVVGINVLGSTSLGSAPNGTTVTAWVDCN